jgi:DNA-binding NarL/FixJ family response regulator
MRQQLSVWFQAEDDIDLIGVVADGSELERIASENLPDVVLADLSLPGAGGVHVAIKVRQVSPQSRVVVLSSLSDCDSVLDSIDSGSVGFLLEDEDGETVVRAVRAAFRGESPLSPRAAKVILGSRSARRGAGSLTDRELQVLRLAAEGMSNKQVAAALAISEKTVKAHMTSVLKSTGTENRSEATRWLEQRVTV